MSTFRRTADHDIPSPIGYLIRKRFPKLKTRQPAQAEGAPEDKASEATPNNPSQQDIDAYRAELKAMSHDQLMALYEQEQEKSRQARVRVDERQRFFGRPEADADFEHWAKATYWSIDEAIALVLGKDPERVDWNGVKVFLDTSPFAKQYARLRDLAYRAKVSRQLRQTEEPGAFLAWAQRTDVEIPVALIEALEHRGILLVDWKERHDKLQNTLDTLTDEYNKALGELRKLRKKADVPGSIAQSNYWQSLENMANQAIHDFPAWKTSVGKVQKTGNLHRWLLGTIGADTREAEIIKKVMSEAFPDLN